MRRTNQPAAAPRELCGIPHTHCGRVSGIPPLWFQPRPRFGGFLFLSFARARVGLVVDLGKVPEIEVSIDLGGTYIGVPEEFLHRPQITACLQ